MTLNELKQLKAMRAEIKRINDRMQQLRREAAGSEEHSERIKELYNELNYIYCKQLEAETNLTRQIAAINDIQIRVSIEMHYIDGKSWNEVADFIGGGNTENAVRKYVSRFITSDMSQINILK